MTTTEKLQLFPPVFVRLLARHRYGRPLNAEEIATRGGNVLTPVEVMQISKATSWDNLSVKQTLAFLAGCGLGVDDTLAWRRVIGYLSHRPTFRFLRASPDWEGYYMGLLKQWRAIHGLVGANSKLWPPLRDLCIRLNPLLKI